MHLDKFDLNLLVSLDALLTEKHVTRAAKKLCVSQPAMSAALLRLRQYFGDQLLEKVGSGLELTPRAEQIAGEVHELLFRIRGTLRSEPSFDPSTGGRDFRLIMSDYVSIVLMPDLTRRLLREAPSVRCHVEYLGTDSLTRVDRGSADFCVTIQERELLEDSESAISLKGELLFADEFVVVVDRDSEAARTSLPLDEFLRLPYIEVRFAHAVASLIDEAIRRQKLPLKPAAITPSFAAAAWLVQRTPMTAIIPRRLAELLAPTLGLVIRPVPFDVPPLCETLVWHGRSDADPAHLWFREFLHEVSAGLDPVSLRLMRRHRPEKAAG